jgi:hypothetical protein
MAKPSAFRAYVEVNGDKQIEESLREIGHRGSHTTPLMAQMVDLLQFQQARRVQSKPWAPLAAGTVERKAREGENTDILRDESRMIKGVPTRVPDAMYSAIVTPNFPGQLRRVTRASATFGLQSAGRGPFFYARFVQNVRGVKRRILAISQKDALTLLVEVDRWLFKGWRVKTGASGNRFDRSGR